MKRNIIQMAVVSLFAIAVVVTLVSAVPAVQVDSNNVSPVFDNGPYRQMAVLDEGANYVYAVGAKDQPSDTPLTTWNITDLSNPNTVTTFPGHSGGSRFLEVDGNYLYATDDAEENWNLWIYDISDPTDPQAISATSLPSSVSGRPLENSNALLGPNGENLYLYNTDEQGSTPTTGIVNITDKQNPTINWISPQDPSNDIAIANGHLYQLNDDTIYELTDSGSDYSETTGSAPWAGLGIEREIVGYQDMIIVRMTGELRKYDVSNPTNPTHVDTLVESGRIAKYVVDRRLAQQNGNYLLMHNVNDFENVRNYSYNWNGGLHSVKTDSVMFADTLSGQFQVFRQDAVTFVPTPLPTETDREINIPSDTPEKRIEIVAPNYMRHGSTAEYSIKYYNGSHVSDVTDSATITSSNNSIVEILTSSNELKATNDVSVNKRITLNATYQGLSDEQDVTVANKTFDNFLILPNDEYLAVFLGLYDDQAIYGIGSEMQFLLVLIFIGGAIARKTENAWSGIGVIAVGLLLLWISGWVSAGIAVIGAFYGIMIGLTLTNIQRPRDVSASIPSRK